MTESEEMYLVSIARLKEAGGEEPVTISRLAEMLGVGQASTNQMIKKLAEGGLVAYTPYKGVDLTSIGEQVALEILRHRRIWEVFLFEHLRYSPAEAETLACRMEHIFPAGGIQRLAKFLGEPVVSPQGRPIPGCLADGVLVEGTRLDQVRTGEGGIVSKVSCGSSERSFLSSQGIQPGSHLKVLAVGGGGDRLVSTDSTSTSTHLSSDIARAIWVTPVHPG